MNKKSKITGRKNDNNKASVTQFLRQFPLALTYISKCSEHGHKLYGQKENDENWDNWKYVENAAFRYKQAAGRHFLETNGDKDLDSGLYHSAHCIWNLLAVLQLKLENELLATTRK